MNPHRNMAKGGIAVPHFWSKLASYPPLTLSRAALAGPDVEVSKDDSQKSTIQNHTSGKRLKKFTNRQFKT
jgi:hypothetical protein